MTNEDRPLISNNEAMIGLLAELQRSPKEAPVCTYSDVNIRVRGTVSGSLGVYSYQYFPGGSSGVLDLEPGRLAFVGAPDDDHDRLP